MSELQSLYERLNINSVHRGFEKAVSLYLKNVIVRQEESIEEEPKEIIAKVEPTPAPLVQNPQPLSASTNLSPSTSTEYEDLLRKMGQLTINLLQRKEFSSQGGDRGPKRNISEVVCYGCYKKGDYKYNCLDRASTSGTRDNDKRKALVNSFDVVDKSINNEVDVFVTKRKKEKDNEDGNDPKKIKGETSKKHRRRKLGVQNFLISERQGPYSILEDLSKRPANITYGQLLAMTSEKRRELRSGLNARRRKEVEVPVLDAEADPYAPQAEVLCNGISIHDVLVDGGVVVNVMTESVMNMLGLKIDRPSTLMLSTSEVDTEDEESEVDVLVLDILPVTPTHEPIKLSEEEIDDRFQQIKIGDVVVESEKESYLQLFRRKFNKATKKDHYSLPFSDQILDEIAGQECYSFADGYSGYNQVRIAEKDQLKTTFTTLWGTDSIGTDPDKVSKIKELPFPMNRSKLRSFLGHVGYYRRFIKNFSKIAQPLTQFLKKDVTYELGNKAHEVFEQLKEALVSSPVLKNPDWSKPFIVYTNASNAALRSTLSQNDENRNDHPVYFGSRQMSSAEGNIKVSNRILPFQLAYGIDPVLPIEFDIPTVRVIKNERMDESDSVKERLVHLHFLEEMIEIAKDKSYKKKMKQKEYFDQKIRWSPFHLRRERLANFVAAQKIAIEVEDDLIMAENSHKLVMEEIVKEEPTAQISLHEESHDETIAEPKVMLEKTESFAELSVEAEQGLDRLAGNFIHGKESLQIVLIHEDELQRNEQIMRSRPCPIRYLANLEPPGKLKPIVLISEHEDEPQRTKDEPQYLSNPNTEQLKETMFNAKSNTWSKFVISLSSTLHGYLKTPTESCLRRLGYGYAKDTIRIPPGSAQDTPGYVADTYYRILPETSRIRIREGYDTDTAWIRAGYSKIRGGYVQTYPPRILEYPARICAVSAFKNTYPRRIVSKETSSMIGDDGFKVTFPEPVGRRGPSIGMKEVKEHVTQGKNPFVRNDELLACNGCIKLAVVNEEPLIDRDWNWWAIVIRGEEHIVIQISEEIDHTQKSEQTQKSYAKGQQTYESIKGKREGCCKYPDNGVPIYRKEEKRVDCAQMGNSFDHMPKMTWGATRSIVEMGGGTVGLRLHTFTNLILINVAFFGTGNVASIASFEISSVYRFITIFNPFIMAALLLFKLFIPFILVTCAFSAVTNLIKLPRLGCYFMFLLFSDVMTIHFFFLVRTTGSWMEIGNSISHFGIMSAQRKDTIDFQHSQKMIHKISIKPQKGFSCDRNLYVSTMGSGTNPSRGSLNMDGNDRSTPPLMMEGSALGGFEQGDKAIPVFPPLDLREARRGPIGTSFKDVLNDKESSMKPTDITPMAKRQSEKCNWWKDALPEHLIFGAKQVDSNTAKKTESISAPKTPLSVTQIVSNMKNAQVVGDSKENDKDLFQDNNMAVPTGANVTKENTPPPTMEASSDWITVNQASANDKNFVQGKLDNVGKIEEIIKLDYRSFEVVIFRCTLYPSINNRVFIVDNESGFYLVEFSRALPDCKEPYL
ncbi:hypothetical protein KI387_034893 [Taxus chinensis]|uniref:Reverse transcriptase/retrotransposon-derived protein RNase H-like domain-containing protein n=1 Tax=Taxus chinensis TaxID=29808 RepID=A0AA38C0U2_TAXCH|nr:hypothetical protein KI387_034893 [Taxus chinensis]